MSELDPFQITWGLFTALETAEELPDLTVDGLLEAAEAEIGTDGLLSGWALVAALLRKLLVDHADQVGCDCGSAEWLEETQLHYAGLPDHTHDDDEM
jgi:hypothetical protein